MNSKWVQNCLEDHACGCSHATTVLDLRDQNDGCWCQYCCQSHQRLDVLCAAVIKHERGLACPVVPAWQSAGSLVRYTSTSFISRAMSSPYVV